MISRRAFNRNLAGSVAATYMLRDPMPASEDEKRRPSLTDIEGILVGHCTLRERPTGCTVITSREAFSAGVDVRGGAPGTRETDLLQPGTLVQKINAIFLSGGSAFGLGVGTGVSRFLEEKGIGYETGAAKVPVVCGAILYDLTLGDPKIRPDAGAGYEAAKSAGSNPVPEGNVGAGAGCTCGKAFGPQMAMKSGLGTWSIQMPDGLKVGAIAAVNPVGDVVDPVHGRIIAGARKTDGSGFAGTMEQLRKGWIPGSPFQHNTVIAVVATNAPLVKVECLNVARMAQDALARCIYPAHTPSDGDAVFAIATGTWAPAGRGADLARIGALAADVLALAIIRGVEQAATWGPYPAARDFRR
jgi:L-aminopeptidase/D-esterase-like protein